MSHTRNGLIAVTVAASLIGAPSRVHSQETFVVRAVTEEMSAQALVLETRAMEFLNGSLVVTHFGEVASLYRRAAELRGQSDIRNADNLRTMGNLEYYKGDLHDAVSTLRSAGENYLALGDVVSAAETFIDGAWVAGRAGMMSEALLLRERGGVLTRSPLLDIPERTALLRRLERVPLDG
jgi:hypothetical protein